MSLDKLDKQLSKDVDASRRVPLPNARTATLLLTDHFHGCSFRVIVPVEHVVLQILQVRIRRMSRKLNEEPARLDDVRDDHIVGYLFRQAQKLRG